MKRNRMLFFFLFFIPLFLLAVLTLLLPVRSFSENENRPLTQMPDLSPEGIQSGSVQSELSSYFSDQVPLRDFWIQANTAIRKLSGQKEINGVYLGDDHYYFQQFTDESYSGSRMVSVFRMMDAFVQKQGLPAAVMLVPSPATVLSDKLPANAPSYNADVVFDTAKQLLSCPVIDLRGCFAQNADSSQLYYRTDHHWTSQGAYLAYRHYCKTLGKTAAEYPLEQASDNFYGTLYSKVLDAAAEPDAIYAPGKLPRIKITYEDGTVSDTPYLQERLAQKDQYTYFFGGNYGIVTLETTAANSEKLLIIKDSFANCFVPYLLGDYSEIVMLDLRYFGGSVEDVITQHGTTQILFLYETSNLLTDTGILRLQGIQHTTASGVEQTYLPEMERINTEDTVTEVITAYPAESVPVAQCGPVGTMSSLFIGDSRTVGLADYADLDHASFFASVGMTVYNVWESKVSVPNVGKVQLKELLNNKQYDIIYIMLGINELGYSFDKTIDRYRSLVDSVRTLQPDAVIILMANIHVTAARSESDKYINNPAVDRFNVATAQLADDKTIFYLDANNLFDDENGNLADEKSADSAHLKAKYCKQWGQWLVNETADILLKAEG